MDAPARSFCFLKKRRLIFLSVYKSCVVDAPAGASSFLKKQRLIFLSVYKSCVTVGRSRRGFWFSSKHKVFICLVYTRPVLRVDAPAGAFCFLQKHLTFFCVYKSWVTGGRYRRGFLFSSTKHLIIFSVYESCVMGGRSRSGFFGFFKSTFLYFWVDTIPVLRVDAPTVFLFYPKTASYIF